AARLRKGGPSAARPRRGGWSAMDLLPCRLGRRRMGGVPWSRAIMFLLAVALAAGVGLAAVGPGPAGPAAGLPSAGLDAVGPIAGPAVFVPIAGASSAALEWPLIVPCRRAAELGGVVVRRGVAGQLVVAVAVDAGALAPQPGGPGLVLVQYAVDGGH